MVQVTAHSNHHIKQFNYELQKNSLWDEFTKVMLRTILIMLGSVVVLASFSVSPKSAFVSTRYSLPPDPLVLFSNRETVRFASHTTLSQQSTLSGSSFWSRRISSRTTRIRIGSKISDYAIYPQMSSSNNEASIEIAVKRVLENFGFSAAQSATLLSISQTEEAKDGEIIFKEGSDILAPMDSSRIYLIISGEVTVSKGNQPFYSATTGDFLGERRFLENEVLDFLGKLRSNPIEEIFAIVDEDRSGAVNSGEPRPSTPTHPLPTHLFTKISAL